jgi:hypothetical protein
MDYSERPFMPEQNKKIAKLCGVENISVIEYCEHSHPRMLNSKS